MYCSTVHAKNCYFLYTVPVLCPVVAYLERRKRYAPLSEFNTITITYSMTLVNKRPWNTSYFIYEIVFESIFQFKAASQTSEEAISHQRCKRHLNRNRKTRNLARRKVHCKYCGGTHQRKKELLPCLWKPLQELRTR